MFPHFLFYNQAMVKAENNVHSEEYEGNAIGKTLYARLSRLWDDENNESGDIVRTGLAITLGVEVDEIEARVRPQYIGDRFIPYNQIFIFRLMHNEGVIGFTGPSFLAELNESLDITKGEFIYECSPEGEVVGYHLLTRGAQLLKTPISVNNQAIPEFIEKGLAIS